MEVKPNGSQSRISKSLSRQNSQRICLNSQPCRSIQKPILKKEKTKQFSRVENPKIVIYIKPWDDDVFSKFLELLKYIQTMSAEYKITCLAEQWLCDKVKTSSEAQELDIIVDDLQVFSAKQEEDRRKIQYLITLGGDGTILYAAKQFYTSYIPPIISFALGSLGYLCSFEFEEFNQVLDKVLFTDFIGDETQDPCLDLRMRLQIEVEDKPLRKVYKGGQLENYEEILIKDYHVINEVVIDRGPSPYCIQVEVYIDDSYFTTCVGDGLIISTPTGSTAYNLAAGGSIMQSNVPAISLTPLAPHSLSFRPLILPENCTIRLRKPEDGRTSAWVSVDGATRFELKDNESILVKASDKAVAFVTDPVENLTDLWAKRLTKLLNWNIRPYMKPLKKKKSKQGTPEKERKDSR